MRVFTGFAGLMALVYASAAAAVVPPPAAKPDIERGSVKETALAQQVEQQTAAATALQKKLNAVSVFRCIDPRLIASNPAFAAKIVAFGMSTPRLVATNVAPHGLARHHQQAKI